MLQTLKIFALYVFSVTGMLGFMGSAEAQTRVSAGFEYGIIGESIKNAHQPERGVLLSTLGISQVVISQLSNNGQFGGTQGNDYEVDVSILFNNGTTTTFAAAVNWRDTSGSTNRGIGLIRPLGSAADGSGYTPQSGYYTSYLLRFVNQTITYSETAAGEKIPEVSGNAATTGLLDALNAYSTTSPPSSTPSVLQTTLTASSTSIAADGTATSTITVQLKDINGNDLSASGGTVALSTDAGTLSSVTDNTDGTYTATLTSATTAGTATITGTLGGTAITDDATVEMTAGSAGQIGGTVLNRQGAAVAGVTVRLRNGSTVIATTTTDASGAYSFSTLSAGTYTVEFAPSAGGKGVKAKSNRGYQNGRFLENITLASDQSITDADAILIDPAGVVYDSITRSPVAGAVVTFNFNDALVPNTWLDQAAGGANTQTTGADGQYSFVLNGTAQSGTYTLDVATPTGYTFQSAVIPVTAGAFDPGLGGGIIAVQTQATAPTGGNATTYYLDFSFTIGTTASNTSNGVINNHIPIDPNPSTATSTITASPTSIVADGTTTSTVTVQLKDANGNDLSASGGTVALSTDAGTLSSVTDNTDGTYTATLTSATTAGTATITGTLGGTAITDDATVEMTDATSPVITGPSGSAGDGTSVISVDENQTAVTQMTATDDVSASGDIVWSLSGDDSGKFTIATDGTITFNTAPDYENPTDADNNNTYVVTVTATDEATNASTQTLTVTVLDLDEVGPTITGPDGSGGTTTGATSAISVDENQTAVTQMTATDDVSASGDIVWSLSGDDSGKFTIATDGTITFNTAPDYENPTDADNNNTYVVTVTATDEATNASTQTLTVTVLDLDEVGPTITGPDGSGGTTTGATSAISVDENQTAVTTVTATDDVSASGDIVWSLSGDDSGKFTIATDGTITFNTAPDYENPTDADNNNTYVVTVTATDEATNASTQTLTVTVLDLDEVGPTITGPDGSGGTTTGATSAISVDENQTAVTQMTATDDVSASGDIVWSLSGDDSGKFTIATDGTITFNTAPDYENPTDADNNNTYVVTVTATDEATNASTQTLTVTVLDLDEVGPTITGPDGSGGTTTGATSAISVDENQTAVTTVTATDDVSASGDIVWSLSGDDSGKFTIATDGTITFNTAPDYENPTDADNNNTYVVTVTATDEATNASTQTLTVTVLDLDEVGPTITGPDGSGGTTTGATSAISVDENQTAVTQMTADETVTWTLTGSDDDAKFAINESTGVITFVAAPDYERPTDVGTNNTYVLTVKATDTASNTSIQTITVTVLDLDDDFAAVLVTNDDLIATEGRSDDNATMNFSLGGQPTSDVVLTFAGDAQCTVSPSTMTFTASDFATRQALSISAINDEDVEGTHSCQQTVEVASTDVRFDSFALALATVTVADDLVDQVRDPLKNILQSDFEQTVATQSRQFSQISKGALDRLQSDEEVRCGIVETLDADGRAQAGAGGFSTSGVFGEEYYDCETGVRRILDGSFAINRSDAVDAQGIVSFTIQHEKQTADEALTGKFFGGYLSSSALDGVATGNLQGVGVYAGLYGARKLQSGLFFDYYAAGGVGRHEYDVSFYAPSALIAAEGDYRYGAVYAGAALSGETVYENVTFRPRVGVDLTYADAIDASVSASQMGFTDLGRIQLDAINGSRIFAETIWIFDQQRAEAADAAGELSLKRSLEVAPRLYCEQGIGRDENNCGYGGYISFNEHNLSKSSDIAVTLDYENTNSGAERFGLDLSYSRDVFNGAGKLATQFGSDASGNATVSQSLSLEF